jgi:hypothetical protein
MINDHNITLAGWQAIMALATLLCVWGLKFMQEWMKDRRDREADRQSIQALRDIAQSNASIVKGQLEQNGKLASVVAVNEAHHTELIRHLDTVCRARCPLNREEK